MCIVYVVLEQYDLGDAVSAALPKASDTRWDRQWELGELLALATQTRPWLGRVAGAAL